MPEAREWFCQRPAALPERCSAIGVGARLFPEGADQWEEAAFQYDTATRHAGDAYSLASMNQWKDIEYDY